MTITKLEFEAITIPTSADDFVCAITINPDNEWIGVLSRGREIEHEGKTLRAEVYYAAHYFEGAVVSAFPERYKIGEACADMGKMFEGATGGQY